MIPYTIKVITYKFGNIENPNSYHIAKNISLLYFHSVGYAVTYEHELLRGWILVEFHKGIAVRY